MKRFIKKILFGITLPQEYLCVNRKDYKEQLKIILSTGNIETDITGHNLLIGYKPLILAIDKAKLDFIDLDRNKLITLSFRTEDGKSIATLKLKMIKEMNLDSASCVICEGVKGSHSITKYFHRILNNLHYKVRADRKKNIYLKGNLFDQVKIAYSVPRNIYLASVGYNGLFNIFPTDLSGPIGENNFIISLRTTGKVNQHIEKSGECLVGIMDPASFMEVYNSGKNHMKELSEPNSFGIMLREQRSETLNLPIPLGTVKYLELKRINNFEFGIHTIHFWKVINKIILSENKSVLAHVHRDIAEWRIRNGIKTNFLLRKS